MLSGGGSESGGEFSSCSRGQLTDQLEGDEAERVHLVYFNAGKRLGCGDLEKLTKQLPQIQILLE